MFLGVQSRGHLMTTILRISPQNWWWSKQEGEGALYDAYLKEYYTSNGVHYTGHTLDISHCCFADYIIKIYLTESMLYIPEIFLQTCASCSFTGWTSLSWRFVLRRRTPQLISKPTPPWKTTKTPNTLKHSLVN